jgi:hypothetical protein
MGIAFSMARKFNDKPKILRFFYDNRREIASPPIVFALFNFFHAYRTDLTAPAEIAPPTACLKLDMRTVDAKDFLSTAPHLEYPARSRASTARAAGSEDKICIGAVLPIEVPIFDKSDVGSAASSGALAAGLISWEKYSLPALSRCRTCHSCSATVNAG